MNPIIERLSDQPKQWWHKSNELMNPLIERLHEQRDKLRHKGNELLTELQERQEKLFDRGQKALNTFEETVLEKVDELLVWAYGISGEKSEVLRKSRDFVGERLTELREAPAETAPEGEAAAEGEGAQAETKAAKPGAVEEPELPFEGYGDLNVKKLAQRFADLDQETLAKAKAYEEATKARKTVLEAIEKHLV